MVKNCIIVVTLGLSGSVFCLCVNSHHYFRYPSYCLIVDSVIELIIISRESSGTFFFKNASLIIARQPGKGLHVADVIFSCKERVVILY